MTFYQTLDTATKTDQQSLQEIACLRAALSGNVTLGSYVAFLEQAYHHVKHTVPILETSIAHLRPEQESLRSPLGMYIEEERGHEEWILDDIVACGGDRDRVKLSNPSEACARFVSYIYDSVRQVNAACVFGMVHVLEGTSIQLAISAASRLKASLGLPDHAFTYLDSHGLLDIEHYDYFRNLMDQVSDEQDRRDILQSARMSFRLYGDILRTLEWQPRVAS